MKSILICSHAMELGGAERVLLGLLEALDKDRYEVDLFLMRHRGELLKDIPEGVRLLPEIPQYACLAVPIREVLRKGRLDMAFGRFVAKQKAKRTRRALGITGENDVELEYSHKFTKKYMPPVSDKTYDLAVSFLTGRWESQFSSATAAAAHAECSQASVTLAATEQQDPITNRMLIRRNVSLAERVWRSALWTPSGSETDSAPRQKTRSLSMKTSRITSGTKTTGMKTGDIDMLLLNSVLHHARHTALHI